MQGKARVTVAVVSVLAALACLSGLLFMLPAVLLVAVLLLGRFPGERRLLARRTRARDRNVLVPRTLGSRGRPPHVIGPVGAALLAFGRAVRPPPSSLVTR
jgi:hypothetical protein